MAVDRMLARCESAWTPYLERLVADAGADPHSWLPPAGALLRASWGEDGRACAVAAAALMEYALDVGPRHHPHRHRWVLHLWLAERTLALRHGDHRLSDDVHHHLAAQTQGRPPEDPVAVAATYPEEPLPRHFAPPRPSERHAARMAEDLPEDDPVRPSLLARLAQAACFRLESGDPSSLDDAERWSRAAFGAITAGHVEADLVSRTAVLVALTRFRARPGDDDAVGLALRAGRTAVRATQHARLHGAHPRHEDGAASHLVLALALMATLVRTLDEELADEAVAQLEAFRSCAPPDDSGLYAGNMASLLAARAFLTGSRPDVERADALWAGLIAELPPVHPLRPHVEQKRAACAQLARMMKVLPSGGAWLLRAASPILGPLLAGVRLPPIRFVAPPRRPGRASPGPTPEDIAAFTGRPRPAPAVPRPAPDPEGADPAWPPLPPDGAGPAQPPSAADFAGLPPDTEAAYRALLGAGPVDPRRLDLAATELRALLAGPALADGPRGRAAAVLVDVLGARFTFSDDPADLAEAVRCGDEQLATLPVTSSRYVDLLCAVERHRHLHGGLHQDVTTVDRACRALRWAVGRFPEESPSWLGCAMHYAHALTTLAMLRRDHATAEEALRLTESAARRLEELPPASVSGSGNLRDQLRPALAQITELARLAEAELRGDRYAVEHTPAWRPEAERTLPPAARFENARTALNGALERREWATAADAAQVALETLPLIVSQALQRDDRQAVLRTALLGRRHPAPAGPGPAGDLPDRLAGTSLGRTACAVALAAGRTEQAAALLEQGRAVLMGQDIQARTDVSDLAAARPAEARAFSELALRLREAEAATGPDEAARVREQHAVAEEWRRLVDRIRRLEGFADFLLPPTVADMRAEAREGPIALINTDRLRSDALVVAADGITAVRLDVTEGLLAHQARRFLAAVSVDRDAPRERREEAAETVFGILEWLWDTIAEPVLDAAGLTDPLSDGASVNEVPRLWWSASGPLAHLPLHAAGHQRKGDLAARRTVLDRVASSYTPSIRALRHARQAPPAADGAGPFLAVSRPTGADGTDGASGAEVAAVARTLGGLRVLEHDEATVGQVLDALSCAATVHFACHGVSDPDDPSRSRLELADGPLGVLDVARRHLPHAQLAVLLACHTARTDRLPDEAIHMTSAFQTAGYPQVVGALWEAADLVSVRLTEHLYRSLRGYGGGLRVADTARALHGIVRGLRARYAGSPAAWAAYVHSGR